MSVRAHVGCKTHCEEEAQLDKLINEIVLMEGVQRTVEVAKTAEGEPMQIAMEKTQTTEVPSPAEEMKPTAPAVEIPVTVHAEGKKEAMEVDVPVGEKNAKEKKGGEKRTAKKASAKKSRAAKTAEQPRAQAGRKKTKGDEEGSVSEGEAAGTSHAHAPLKKRVIPRKKNEEVALKTVRNRVHKIEEAAKRVGSGEAHDTEMLLEAAYHHVHDHKPVDLKKLEEGEVQHEEDLEAEAQVWMPAVGGALEHIGVSATLRASVVREVAQTVGLHLKNKQIAGFAHCSQNAVTEASHSRKVQALVSL